MKNISKNISDKIDSKYVEILRIIDKITGKFNISFFIIGAIARDIIFEYTHNIKCPLITKDIDLGVRVQDWNKYHSLTKILIDNYKFENDKYNKQRYLYNDVFVDVIPFGKIAGKDNIIFWSPEQGFMIKTFGFEEVFNYSANYLIAVNPILKIKVPTLAGLTIMKILSWHFQYPERNSDAKDLLFIFERYEDIIEEKILYEKKIKLLEEEEFRTDLACIRILGEEISNITNRKTLSIILEILFDEINEDKKYQLIPAMMDQSHDFETILLYLNKLIQGICSGNPSFLKSFKDSFKQG